MFDIVCENANFGSSAISLPGTAGRCLGGSRIYKIGYQYQSSPYHIDGGRQRLKVVPEGNILGCYRDFEAYNDEASLHRLARGSCRETQLAAVGRNVMSFPMTLDSSWFQKIVSNPEDLAVNDRWTHRWALLPPSKKLHLLLGAPFQRISLPSRLRVSME